MMLQPIRVEKQMATIPLVTGVTLNYLEQGDDRGDVVLLLHGWTDSSHSYARVLPLLDPGHHVYALDQRGHGDSSRPACCYAMYHFAADVIAFLDAHQIGQATVVGHSMGSIIAQLVAIHYPARVARLVLIGSTARANNATAREVNEALQSLTDPLDPAFVQEFQTSNLSHSVPADFVEQVISESLKVPAHVWRLAFGNLLKVDTMKDLPRISAPTLILWGDQDGLFPRSDQETLRQLIPQATLRVYEETGHNLQWEQPERFVADFEQFMQATA